MGPGDEARESRRRGPALLALMLLAGGGLLTPARGAGGPASPGPAAVGGSPPVAGTLWVEREAWLMGTRLRVTLRSSSRDEGFAAAGRALEAVRRVEERWSSWRADSRLSRLNRATPGEPAPLPAPMARVLAQLGCWHERTGGALDPAVGPLIDAWGLRDGGRRPREAELDQARAASGLRHFRVDPAAGTVTRLRGDAWLDAGAFGKGLALDRARRLLRTDGVGAALLDFGGQLVAWGGGPDRRRCWRIGVADPRRRGEAEVALELCDASASTTSGSERFVRLDGQIRSHLLDPRSGRPAPAWGSVTVVHEDPATADLLSTALFVMGPDEGLRWARERELAALFLEIEGRTLRHAATEAMDRRMTRITPSGEDTR